jgi:hypothetical protein
MSETKNIQFPSFMREEFEKTMEKVNKKLRKIKGATDVSILEEREFLVARKGTNYEFTEVTVSLPIEVKHKGFEYLGTISLKDGVKTIYAENEDNLADVHTEICQHCGTKRNRNHYHVFRKT